MRTWIGGALTAGLVAFALLAWPPGAAAEDAHPAKQDPMDAMGQPPGEGAPIEQREAYWRAKAKAARERADLAQQRVTAAEYEYRNRRQRQRRRGEHRAEVAAERDAAARELEEAVAYLEVGLPEEARQAGALPGWLRE
jgi:hypothetical protein